MNTCQSNRRRRHWVWIGAVVLLLLSACSNGDDAAPATATESTEAPTVDSTTTTSTTAAPTTTAETTTTEAPCPAFDTSTAPAEPEAVAPVQPLTSPTARAVADQGRVRVGVNSRPGKVTAFEALLIDEVVARMFGDVLIEPVPLSAVDRWDKLPEVDFMIRNSTATTSRSEYGLFTSAYFIEGYVIASRPGESVDLPCFSGTLARLAGTTFGEAGEDLLNEISDENFQVVQAEDPVELINLLEAGDADLVIMFTALYLDNADRVDIAAPGAIEPINAWVYEDADFRDELDRELANIIADGTWDALYLEAFGESPYFTIDQMRSAPIPDW